VENRKVDGFSFDINNDRVADVFFFLYDKDFEGNYEFERVLRIYFNINGVWKQKWVELIEYNYWQGD
jgi:hypothetical protein